MLMPNPNIAKPFVPTHTRAKDQLPAMLIVDNGADALYRVQFTEREVVDRLTCTTSDHFARTFKPC